MNKIRFIYYVRRSMLSAPVYRQMRLKCHNDSPALSLVFLFAAYINSRGNPESNELTWHLSAKGSEGIEKMGNFHKEG